jgi:hypothetical protein
MFFSTHDRAVEGEATVIDLSKTGCAAESENLVEPSMMLELSIFLPSYDWRLHIDRRSYGSKDKSLGWNFRIYGRSSANNYVG